VSQPGQVQYRYTLLAAERLSPLARERVPRRAAGDDRYRQLEAQPGETVVRIVLCEYLTCEVVW
jgi:hypothetical protein